VLYHEVGDRQGQANVQKALSKLERMLGKDDTASLGVKKK